MKRKAKTEIPIPDTMIENGHLFTGKNSDVRPAIPTHFRDALGKFTDGNPGSPKRFTNAEDLKREVTTYFQECDQRKEALTMTGLAMALGFRSRQALINYEKEPGYEFAFDIILYAKMAIEKSTELRLHDPKNYNIGGAIFSLKNNWNWVDKSEVKVDQRSMTLTGFNFIHPIQDATTEDGNN